MQSRRHNKPYCRECRDSVVANVENVEIGVPNKTGML